MISNGATTFRPRARLIRLLGEELISDEAMAVAELVKNSYDADASSVTVRLLDVSAPAGGWIEIIDDGTGMSLETLLDTWLEPATSFKKPNGRKRRTPGGRYPLGEKGVGRFATDKIGAHLEMVSRLAQSDDEVVLCVSWEAFEDGNYLDEVKNLWEVRRPKEFKGARHGTILRMRKLRREWDRPLVERIHEALARLISPTARSGGFRMSMDAPGFPEFDGPIEDRLLSKAPYQFAGIINSSGYLARAGANDSVEDLRPLAGQHFKTSSGFRTPCCGAFSVDFSVWDLDALGPSSGRLSRPLRSLLRRSSGVSIYRDGFRIAPYGDRDDDWLELNQRRVNNPTMRVSTNQIVGTVEVTQEANPALRDRTSREGLLDTPAFHDLKALVTAALSRLEDERYAERKASAGPPVAPGEDVVLDHLTQARRDGGGLQSIQAATNAYKRYRQEAEQRERILMKLASSGAAARTLIGQLNGSVSMVRRILPFLSSLQSNLPELDDAQIYVSLVSQQLDALERMAGRGLPSLSTFDLRSLAQDALTIYSQTLASANIRAMVMGSHGLSVHGERPLILQALLHVVENAILATEGSIDERWIEIAVQRDAPQMCVRDSGVGVPENRRALIFDPFFTAREGADGLGLYFARSLLRNSGADLVLAEENPSEFRFVFPSAD